MPVEEVKRLGRSTQGVIVMRLRGDEQVSSIAPVVEGEADPDGEELPDDVPMTGAELADDPPEPEEPDPDESG